MKAGVVRKISRQKSVSSCSKIMAIAFRTILSSAILFQFIGMFKVGLVTSLATNQKTTNVPHRILEKRSRSIYTDDDIHYKSRLFNRRAMLHGSLVGLAAAVLVPKAASAGIDVSGLKVEANPLDVFMGGTYYEDDGPERDGVDGRISRRKYTIVEAGSAGSGLKLNPTSTNNKKKVDFFEGLENRPIKVLGESTSISSSRDDALELSGDLYLCNENGSKGCITIDLSPIGGPAEAKGYWDEKEAGIRFLGSQKVWSKQ